MLHCRNVSKKTCAIWKMHVHAGLEINSKCTEFTAGETIVIVKSIS